MPRWHHTNAKDTLQRPLESLATTGMHWVLLSMNLQNDYLHYKISAEPVSTKRWAKIQFWGNYPPLCPELPNPSYPFRLLLLICSRIPSKCGQGRHSVNVYEKNWSGLESGCSLDLSLDGWGMIGVECKWLWSLWWSALFVNDWVEIWD